MLTKEGIQASRLTLRIFTGTVGKEDQRMIEAGGDDTSEGSDYVIYPSMPHFRVRVEMKLATSRCH